MSSFNSNPTASGHFLVVAGEAEQKTARPAAPAGGAQESKVVLPLRRDAGDGLENRQEKEKETPEERTARLEKEAYEKGFEQGRRDGLALEEKQVQEKEKQFRQLFRELEGLKAVICTETEKQMLELSVAVAKKVIREEIKIQPQIIRNMVKTALDFLVDKSHIRILINPDDMEEVRGMLPEIAAKAKGGSFQVVEDQAIGRGGCYLETGFGNVNATLEDQIGMVEEAIEQSFKAYEGKG